jgi:hypothetical protein
MLPPKKSNKKPNPVKKYKKTIFVDPNTEEGRLRHEAFKDSLILSTVGDPENWYNNELRKKDMKINSYLKGKNILLDPERVKRALANKPIGTKKILSEKGGYTIHHQVKTVNGKKISDTVVGKTKEKDKYRVKNVYASPQIEVKFLKPNKDKSRVITPIEQLELPLPKFVDIPKIEFPTSIITNTTTEPAVETSAVTPVKKGFVDKFYNTDPARGKVEKPGTEPNVRYRPVSNSFELKKWQEQQLAYGTNSQGIMKNKMNPRKKYSVGTDMFGIQPLALDFQEETPAQKAARLRAEAKANKAAELAAQKQAIEDARLKLVEANNQKRAAGDVKEAAQRVVIDQRMQNTANVQGKTLEQVKAEANELYQQNLLLAEKAAKKRARESNKNDANPNAASCRPGDALQKTLGQKLAYGSSGINTNNYIPSPADVMNDYNIMLAKTEAEANSNDWLPIVATVGGLLQQGIGMAGSFKKGPKSTEDTPDIDASNKNGVVAAMGMNDVQQDVEVEGGEMYETPQGEVGEFQGPTHEEGGIPLEVGQDVEEGTKVYSDRLKVGKKTLAERKATRERQVANLEKIASNNLADQAVKNAAKRKMMAIEKEEAADLAFQEQVNNMQAMADTMVAAFGTGMAGIQDNPIGDSMRYGYGSGADGVTKYANGTDEYGITPFWMLPSSTRQDDPNYVPPFKKDITGSADYDTNIIKNFHDIIGIKPDVKGGGYGTAWGEKSNKALFDYKAKNNPEWAAKMKKEGANTYGYTKDEILEGDWNKPFREMLGITEQGYKYNGPQIPDMTRPTSEEESFVEPTGVLAGMEKAYQEKMTAEKAAALKANPPGTVFSRTASKVGEAVGKMGVPGMGDMTKLIGNYLGMTAGIKTAAEQRSTDVTKTNVYKDAGKESQRLLDNAKQGIETSKAQAIVKATDVGRGGKRGARGSARGVNQMRGMDWLYDTALQTEIGNISAKAAEQMSSIDIQKSGVAMNTDQLSGQGEWQAIMANDADKDAYYTALALGRKDFATGLQQSGKDLNDMKQNKVVQNLLSQYGNWFKANADGSISNKNTPSKTTTKEEEVEITGPDGKKVKVAKSLLDNLMKSVNTK